jgi:hypothetical protein
MFDKCLVPCYNRCMNDKRHTHCKQGHELTDENTYQVYNKNGTKNGRRCRLCTKTPAALAYKNAKAKEYYANDPEKFKAVQRDYRSRTYVPKVKLPKTHCKRGHEWIHENIYTWTTKQNHVLTCCKLCAKEKYSRRALQVRENHLQRAFGLTLQQFGTMLEEQGGTCYLCKTTVPGGNGDFHVDHCHKSGKIRKLLCMECNRALGAVKDDPVLLRRMADYLEQHQ